MGWIQPFVDDNFVTNIDVNGREHINGPFYPPARWKLSLKVMKYFSAQYSLLCMHVFIKGRLLMYIFRSK